eukprot:355356-Chlamydomonas_euryale.AAC.4
MSLMSGSFHVGSEILGRFSAAGSGRGLRSGRCVSTDVGAHASSTQGDPATSICHAFRARVRILGGSERVEK